LATVAKSIADISLINSVDKSTFLVHFLANPAPQFLLETNPLICFFFSLPLKQNASLHQQDHHHILPVQLEMPFMTRRNKNGLR